MFAWLSATDVTVVLRWVLVFQALMGAIVTEVLFRRSDDTNPYPWRAASIVYVLYAVNVFLLLVDSRLVVDGWRRPIFSLLNICALWFPLWIAWRLIRLHRYRTQLLGERDTLTFRCDRRTGTDRRSMSRRTIREAV